MADVETIETAAANPQEASVDGVKMVQHSLPDLIAAEKHVAAKRARRDKYRGIRYNRIVPPGTTSNNEG